ncbi:MAG: alanine racemase [Clostridia bacterium]|nr:alanine racemase [Clostridia bacterium]
MNDFFKRTWAQINLDAIENNFLQVKSALKKGTKIMCVLKADAYGHGAEVLAHEYERLGAEWFAVSNLEEAIQLRDDKILKPILILGFTPPKLALELNRRNVTQTVFSKKYAEELSKEAVSRHVTINIHIKVDTGMSRLGFIFQDKDRDLNSIDEIQYISNLPNLNLEGIFTHFAIADEPGFGVQQTLNQYEKFRFLIEELEQRNVHIPIKHCSNSAAILNYENMNLDMVRAGLILYGLYPSDYKVKDLNLTPAMELKSVISQIKEVAAGTKVSYGCTYTTEKTTKIATVPIGYADGYIGAFAGKAYMLINGQKARIIGKICMDQLMLDVTDIKDISENSEVVVFGRSGSEYISIDDLAKIAGTINYELLCLLSKRVPRIYVKNSDVVDQLNYICPTDGWFS